MDFGAAGAGGSGDGGGGGFSPSSSGGGSSHGGGAGGGSPGNNGNAVAGPAAAAATERWTCEACGCHTNLTASDRNCSICGTSPQAAGSAGFYRRAVVGRAMAGGGAPGGASFASSNRAAWVSASRLQRAAHGGDAASAAAAAAGARAGVPSIWDSLGSAGGGAGAGSSSLDEILLQVAASNDAAAAAGGGGLGPLMDSAAHVGALSHMMNSRFLEAARAFSNLEQQAAAAAVVAAAAAAQQQRQQQQQQHQHQQQQQQVSVSPMAARAVMTPNEVLTAATLAAPDHGPLKWADPATLVPAPRHAYGASSTSSSSTSPSSPSSASSSSGIRVHDNLAHVPVGAPEGRAIRTEAPLHLNGCYGFRVAFDHPGCGGIGENLGGCYLVGVVTSAFAQYGESNTLSHSPHFYGIEDSGRKYVGARRGGGTAASLAAAAASAGGGARNYGSAASGNAASSSSASRGLRRAGAAAGFAQDLSPADVPFNAHNVLFGCQEVLTVVYHGETLTFWRDDVLLGTLITTLPRASGTLLYPAVVPFNRGVTVAVTGLEANPVPLLRTFAADWKQAQLDQDNHTRRKLAQERSALIQNGQLTEALRQTLISIFTQYCSDGETSLSYCAAARLWYRCGLRLSCLGAVLESQQRAAVVVDDFLQLLDKVAAEDEHFAASIGASIAVANQSPPGSPAKLLLDFPCQVGDKVELVQGYEKFGDATGGPLHPGDRGVVVETQLGPNGERRSVRVLFDGRRWWYQPQAIVPERSGLIETPGVWFLKKLLRAHSFDHVSLQPLDHVAKGTSLVGDWVKVKGEKPYFGRIASDAECTSPSRGSVRESVGTVPVEFVDKAFGDSCGVRLTLSDAMSDGSAIRRVRMSKIVHCSPLVVVEDVKGEPVDAPSSTDGVPRHASDRHVAEIAALSRLDGAAMDFITKECGKSSDALASLFSSGLPSAILTAIDVAERQMGSLEPKEDLPEKIAVIGRLACVIAKQLFASDATAEEVNAANAALTEMELDPVVSSRSLGPESELPEPGDAPNLPSSEATSRRAQSRRLRMRDVLSRRDPRRQSGDDAQAQGMATIQQRRSMLLSLMSRSRRGESSFFNDIMDQEMSVYGTEVPPVPPLRDSFYSTQLNTASGSSDDSISDAHLALNDLSTTFLDTVLRCRGSGELPGTRMSPSSTFFVRQLIAAGLLVNSVSWLKACVDSQAKKHQAPSTQKSSSILKGLVDDEGTTLLHLAVSLGCKTEVLSFLVGRGSTVESRDIQKAAETDQADSLAILLKHSPMKDIDISQYGPSVQRVFTQERVRKEQLDHKMREEVGGFMVDVLRRFVQFGLKARQRNIPRVELCSKSIAEVLVGNSLLQSLQTNQPFGSGRLLSSGPSHEDDSTAKVVATEGILGIFPSPIIREAFLSDDNFVRLLALLDDFLCSKAMNDGAAGLSLLLVMLQRFPELRHCAEIQRFGLIDLVAFHDDLATARTAEIQRRNRPGTSIQGQSPTVCCPSKHIAVLFITRHSSFRCDLCGDGVDRGRPMHGCRECDWDVCESCTDKAQSGAIKCSSIKDLAATVRGLLTEEEGSELMLASSSTSIDTSYEFLALTDRLLRRDTRALKDIGSMLLSPGKVSNHQFLTFFLPAFHSAFFSASDEDDLHLHAASGSGRRCKKPRMIDGLGDLSLESPEDKLTFCSQSIRLLASGDDVCDEVKRSVADSSNSESDPSPRMIPDDYVFSNAFQELLRRLHQILAMREDVQLVNSTPESFGSTSSADQKRGDLQSLTKPIELRLGPSKFGVASIVDQQMASLSILVEPLVPISDVASQVLRSCRVYDETFVHHCKTLARHRAILVVKEVRNAGFWRLAEVVSFDEPTGAHCMRFGSSIGCKIDSTMLLVDNTCIDDFLNAVKFDEASETLVMLATRQYFILSRKLSVEAMQDDRYMDTASAEDTPLSEEDAALRALVGGRIEVKGALDRAWEPQTLLSVDSKGNATTISDTGVVSRCVSRSMIRSASKPVPSESLSADSDPLLAAWVRDDRRARVPGLPVLSSARTRLNRSSSSAQEPATGMALKRSWSALSIVDSTHPVTLRFNEGQASVDQEHFTFKVRIGDPELTLICDSLLLETPPRLSVKFSFYEKLPGIDFRSSNVTLLGALRQLQIVRDKCSRWNFESSVQLFYTIETDSHYSFSSDSELAQPQCETMEIDFVSRTDLIDRSRKLSSRSLGGEDDGGGSGLCEGLDDVCLKCMEAIGLLSEFASDVPVQSERDVPVESLFANSTLSRKLNDQLDDALVVVGRALPEWCTLGPSMSPRVFSYESRKLLLERYAFGVSRSALKQQEAKTDVGRFRQRMASLRARAVELVGEAFSGGAEDPTALQLQADELYGMEEALAARVRAAFRALKWQEHVLDVAKAVVRRTHLLSDAASTMQRFTEGDVRNRRLEVRFEGESGFDAASGSEAGVTRGFYADVAESLLSTENVASIYCSTRCSTAIAVSSTEGRVDVDAKQAKQLELPLWIPDLDASGQVVIPTPRAAKRSAPGVFPRPLPHYHPQISQVLDRFRLMGRLFAAAIRDGFMFPLPLSSSFLKLVQRGGPLVPSNRDSSKAAHADEPFLTSSDLPRPGFLGGEVAAAEAYVCRALDSVDANDPPLSSLELERRYKEIALDRKFARVALSKLFDCSFEDYFQDRTFVDPLDPTQGEDAVPLCPGGHRKHVTIYNVREWVSLCKKFMLHDGVVAQAQAFRLGVEDFFDVKYLCLFTPEELQRDICGVGDNVDHWDEASVRKLFKLDGGKGAAEALVAVAAIGGEGGAAMSRRFGPSSPTISYLVTALLDATPQQRRQFLNFVTSVPIVTPGRIEVVPIVSPSGEFLPMNDPSCLPRANTCARRLYLPKFESQESFSQVIWAVVSEESKFKGFFEWRGN